MHRPDKHETGSLTPGIGEHPADTSPQEQTVCFPFIVGCWRSGTTLLRLMLDSNPDLAIPNESHFIPQLSARWLHASPTQAPWEAFAEDLVSNDWFSTWGLSENDVRRSLSDVGPGSFPEAMRCIFALYARERGKTRYGDKTPSYIQCMPRLAALFPEGRFIHIVRDGRDVALSIMELGFGAETLDRAALEWAHRVRRGRRAGRRLGRERYLEVRYETLVDAPTNVLLGICEFLDLPFSPDMLRYFDRADDALRGLNERRRRFHRHLYSPPSARLRDWRQQMHREQVVVFEALAGDVLEEFGYETTVPKLSLGEYARARRAELIFQTERVRGRLVKMRTANQS
jgi:hypothetical protein